MQYSPFKLEHNNLQQIHSVLLYSELNLASYKQTNLYKNLPAAPKG